MMKTAGDSGDEASGTLSAAPGSGASDAGPGANAERFGKGPDGMLVGLLGLFGASVILFFGLWQNEQLRPVLREFVQAWWPLLGLVMAAIVLAIAARVRGKRFTDAEKSLLVTILAIPFLVLLLYTVVLMPERPRRTTLIILFVLVATILPAAMHYLFVITRRPSLFDEYITNLMRLRLIPAAPRQVDAYLQKFEAAYGPINTADRDRALAELADRTTTAGAGDSTGEGWGLKEKGVGSLMTPSILLPLGLTTLLIGLGWLLVLPLWERQVTILSPHTTAVGFGFLGAYFYSTQALFRRFLRRDLRPAVYISVGQRIVLTIIATWVMTAVVQPDALAAVSRPVSSLVEAAASAIERRDQGSRRPATGSREGAPAAVGAPSAEAPVVEPAAADAPPTAPVADDAAAGPNEASGEPLPPAPVAVDTDEATLGAAPPQDGDQGAESASDRGSDGQPRASLVVLAFLLGMFPRFLWDFLLNGAGRLLGARKYLERMQSAMPLSSIDGLSFWHEGRLEEEDIENAPNLATCDLVELMLNTRFPMNRLVDWIDQAILVTSLGKNATSLEKLAAQGVRTASALLMGYEKATPEGEDRAAYEELLGAAGRSPVRTLVDTLGTNPNLALIRSWQRGGRAVDPGKPAGLPGAAG